jgi:hypothetical protein
MGMPKHETSPVESAPPRPPDPEPGVAGGDGPMTKCSECWGWRINPHRWMVYGKRETCHHCGGTGVERETQVRSRTTEHTAAG